MSTLTISGSSQGGTELGSAATTSTFTTTSGTFVDVTGLTITVTVGSRPIWLQWYCPNVKSSNALLNYIQLVEGGTTLQIGYWQGSAANVPNGAMVLAARLTPSVGSHTYKVQCASTSAGTLTLTAGATGPMLLSAVEL